VAQLVLALSLGSLAAVSMSLVAGSRRSSSVVQRFFDEVPRYDVLSRFSPLHSSPPRRPFGWSRQRGTIATALSERTTLPR